MKVRVGRAGRDERAVDLHTSGGGRGRPGGAADKAAGLQERGAELGLRYGGIRPNRPDHPVAEHFAVFAYCTQRVCRVPVPNTETVRHIGALGLCRVTERLKVLCCGDKLVGREAEDEDKKSGGRWGRLRLRGTRGASLWYVEAKGGAARLKLGRRGFYMHLVRKIVYGGSRWGIFVCDRLP